MQIFQVGGAVRDKLLGLPVHDRDYVVVGATVKDMLDKGFIPVGKDFPVFLHPKTKEEYALARTERKTAPGYKGFVIHADPNVTLEEDLLRRDLTINAMAQDANGHIIDPFGGQHDIEKRLFRHVSAAFNEDPVRILRLARFAARFTAFNVAPETQQLMQDMVVQSEVDALVPERVWQELSRGLMEKQPSRMLQVLESCGALSHLLPEISAVLQDKHAQDYLQTLNTAQTICTDLSMYYAVLCAPLRTEHFPQNTDVTAIEQVSSRLKVPKECLELAVMTAREYANMMHLDQLSAEDRVNLMMRCDVLRKPERFSAMLEVIYFLLQQERTDSTKNGCGWFLTAGQVLRAVDAGKIAQDYRDQPKLIPQKVAQARIAAITRLMQSDADTARR